MIENFNTAGLLFFNNFASSDTLATLFWYIADLPIFFLPLFLIFTWLYYVIKNKNEQKKSLLFIVYSTIVALIINIIIQKLVHFDRPESALQNSWRLILEHIPDASFPSDHTAVSIAFVTAIYLFGFRKIALIFLPFALLMNTSRIIVWVHWPLDVIVGTIIWFFSALFVYKFLQDVSVIKKLNLQIIKIASFFRL
jgi:undecaprenyl-diphosphatase